MWEVHVHVQVHFSSVECSSNVQFAGLNGINYFLMISYQTSVLGKKGNMDVLGHTGYENEEVAHNQAYFVKP